MTTRATIATLSGIVAAATALYGVGLEHTPIHLHHDEIYFGLIAHSVAETARDPLGRLLPVYFQMGDNTFHWYPPVIIYATAAWLKFVPLSDAAVRFPNALVGAGCVMLMYFVARRLVPPRLSIVAAAMLALSPAHFINSRIATDSLYPSAVTLAWLLALARYLEQPSARRLFLATTLLGIGVYTYVASVVTMPIHLAITIGAVLWRQGSWRHAAPALAGFAWPLLFAAGFLTAHPEMIGHFVSKYGVGEGMLVLDPMQRIREALTPWNVSDHLNLYFSAFSPGYLFVTGGAHVAHSTRVGGVFLAPVAVFLVAGLAAIIRQPSALAVITVAALLAAPVASTIMPDAFAILRMMTIVPLGIVISAVGVQFLMQLPRVRLVERLTMLTGTAMIAVGAGYGILRLATHGDISGGAVVLAAAGAIAAATAWQCSRRGNWRPSVIALLIAMPLQFAWFAFDYFGDYRVRSVPQFEYNIRGAIEEIVALHDRAPGARLYLNEDVLFIDAFWEYYLRLLNRGDLRGREIMFNSGHGLPEKIDPGSLILTDVNSRAMAALHARRDLVVVGQATDPVPFTSPVEERPTFLIFQKR